MSMKTMLGSVDNCVVIKSKCIKLAVCNDRVVVNDSVVAVNITELYTHVNKLCIDSPSVFYNVLHSILESRGCVKLVELYGLLVEKHILLSEYTFTQYIYELVNEGKIKIKKQKNTRYVCLT